MGRVEVSDVIDINDYAELASEIYDAMDHKDVRSFIIDSLVQMYENDDFLYQSDFETYVR